VALARSEGVLQKLVKLIEEEGGGAMPFVLDVADAAQVQAAAQAAIGPFGRIDSWINNAGVSIYARLDQGTEEDHRRLFDTNFWGVVNGSLTALPYLKRQGGALINLGSEVSDAVIPLQGMYSASKHAVKGFTDALRVEVELIDKAPVSITLIQPTAVNTPYPQHARNYLDAEPKLPTPKIDPHDVAVAILNAAMQGGRDVKVGTMAVLDTAMAKLFPALGDRFSAQQKDRQQRDLPPQQPEGALHRACESGRIHGIAA
jgi:NADP-dependent 3-hydroxy acid dehydrogenase YdfG